MKFTRPLLLAAALVVCSAHVGSPDVWFDGVAGPYSLRVFIRAPQVIPGLADITVRVRGGATRVQVAPARWDTGTEGTPEPDVARPVRGDAELFSAQLWLMARGAYRIVVTVDGSQGQGTVVVPVTARATEQLAMPRLLGAVLLGAVLFLLAGLITIVGAAVRESALEPGIAPDARRLRKARTAMAAATAVIALLMFGGWRWWDAVDVRHRSRLDRPLNIPAQSWFTADGTQVLRLPLAEALQQLSREPQAGSPLLPDHGKFMHMFLIRSDQNGFAHLHPAPLADLSFDALLPTLPAGLYNVYADIVQTSGAALTLVSTVEVGPSSKSAGAVAAAAPTPTADSDDSSWADSTAQNGSSETVVLNDSVTVHWLNGGSVRAQQEVELAAELTNADGRPAVLEPYMGMAGHLVVQHHDGSVFVHLHPQGTISMAAQQALAAGIGHNAAHNTASAAQRLVFPYAFPRPGRYRVWLQVRHQGQVLTAARDFEVAEAERR